MRKNLKTLYENICRSFYRINQRINNKLTIIRQRFYKLSKKQRNNSYFELNFTSELNLNDFKNVLI